MATDIPAGIEIERIFVIEATYAPDAAETRPRVRPEHLGRIAKLMKEGVVIDAGGYIDLSKAILFVRAADEEAALKLAREDVYMREGVWVEVSVKPFGLVAPSQAG